MASHANDQAIVGVKLCEECLETRAAIAEVQAPFHAFCSVRCQERFYGLATASVPMGNGESGGGGGSGGMRPPLASLVKGQGASQGFALDLEGETRANTAFRRVVANAGTSMQLVLMSITPGDREIGMERHEGITQFFRVESGRGRAVVGDMEMELYPGAAFVVLGGVLHNVTNVDEVEALKLYTIYSPAHHPPGHVDVRRPLVEKAEKKEIKPSLKPPVKAPPGAEDEDVVIKKRLQDY